MLRHVRQIHTLSPARITQIECVLHVQVLSPQILFSVVLIHLCHKRASGSAHLDSSAPTFRIMNHVMQQIPLAVNVPAPIAVFFKSLSHALLCLMRLALTICVTGWMIYITRLQRIFQPDRQVEVAFNARQSNLKIGAKSGSTVSIAHRLKTPVVFGAPMAQKTVEVEIQVATIPVMEILKITAAGLAVRVNMALECLVQIVQQEHITALDLVSPALLVNTPVHQLRLIVRVAGRESIQLFQTLHQSQCANFASLESTKIFKVKRLVRIVKQIFTLRTLAQHLKQHARAVLKTLSH